MKVEIKKLHNIFGNHSKVAQKLGISVRYYRSIRLEGVKPSKPIRILMKELVNRSESIVA